ncbi:MAG: penicillin-insensitive murein endopeptidase [Hyphomicrobiales bacterium]
MRRLILSLSLLLLCTGVAAEQIVAKARPKPVPPHRPRSRSQRPEKHRQRRLPGVVRRRDQPAPLSARAIGSYSKGCLAGGVSLPLNGPDWQVMRTSRNRNWGSPQLPSTISSG